MKMFKDLNEYHIVHHMDYQRMCVTVTHQAEDEKSTTAKERSSQPFNPPKNKKWLKNRNLKKFFK